MPRSRFTLVALMRHATTEWNEAGRIQGWLDSPLSLAGRVQAGQWATALSGRHFSRIIASDLGRALETARIMAEPRGLPVTGNPRFRERDFGTLAGADTATCRDISPQDTPGGGESLAEVRQRVMDGLLDLGQTGDTGSPVLLVTHAGVLESVLSLLAGPAHPLREGRLLKSRRLHWVGVSKAVGLVKLNHRIRS